MTPRARLDAHVQHDVRCGAMHRSAARTHTETTNTLVSGGRRVEAVEGHGRVTQRRGEVVVYGSRFQQSQVLHVNRRRRRRMQAGDEVTDGTIPRFCGLFLAAFCVALRGARVRGVIAGFVLVTGRDRRSRLPAARPVTCNTPARAGELDLAPLVDGQQHAKPQAREREDGPSQ